MASPVDVADAYLPTRIVYHVRSDLIARVVAFIAISAPNPLSTTSIR